MIREPSAAARSAAAILHEVFVALVEQGFTEEQALAVVASIAVRLVTEE